MSGCCMAVIFLTHKWQLQQLIKINILLVRLLWHVVRQNIPGLSLISYIILSQSKYQLIKPSLCQLFYLPDLLFENLLSLSVTCVLSMVFSE